MESSKLYAVAYVDLDNFKAYNDTYGFTQGDELIKSLTRILLNTVSELSRDDYFVFIVPLDRVETVAKEVIKRFKLLVPSFLNEKDQERGYFAIVPVWKGKFKHIGEISARAAEVKR